MSPLALPIAELKPALTGFAKVIAKRMTLPVLSHLKIERTKDGWIALTATDLDSFLTLRLEQPASGEPVSLLVPYDELVKIAKNCPKDDTLLIRSDGKASTPSVIIQYAIGNQVAEAKVGSLPVEEFPTLQAMKVLLIDNYDSFTWNLWQLISSLGADCVVHPHDRVSLDDIAALRADRIVISPGPGTPADAGVSCDVIRRFGPTIPILGVCLGHQCIASVFAGPLSVTHASKVMHGKTSAIFHNEKSIFHGLPSPFSAARYHSLIVEELPADFELLAWTGTSKRRDVIMGMRHKNFPIVGVQFHPVSFLTEHGEKLMQKFLTFRS